MLCSSLRSAALAVRLHNNACFVVQTRSRMLALTQACYMLEILSRTHRLCVHACNSSGRFELFHALTHAAMSFASCHSFHFIALKMK